MRASSPPRDGCVGHSLSGDSLRPYELAHKAAATRLEDPRPSGWLAPKETIESNLAARQLADRQRQKAWTKHMPFNFRNGMRRLSIVVSVLGSVTGGIWGYLLLTDAYALTANRFLQESVLVEDCVVALSLPILGFLVPWEVIHFVDWVWAGLSGQPSARGQGHIRYPVDGRRGPHVPRKSPGTATRVGAGNPKSAPNGK